MRIHIEELEFDTIIGILDFERVTPQKVIINLWIDYDYIDEFIDYAEVSSYLKEYIRKSEFLLIEDALSSVSKNLKEKFPLINRLYLKITKPSIMPDSRVSVSDTYSFLS
jgi:7,8-dihydroneopterin aldolase/epimerase/oxygenase